ncbi:hypothetical protein K1X76_08685 [bacterium]|nr:hypothetical protein [bacterium]
MSYLQLAKKFEENIPNKNITSDDFCKLGVAILLTSNKYGDCWIIPNMNVRTCLGESAVTFLPDEIEVLQKMDEKSIKGVFLVKRSGFGGSTLIDHKLKN